ncbi:hypothetical protein AMTR_s00053p00193170 [Amborella trichopoda]|uniref:Uncharacterized protein n=1 Tax=Amborella trichopoda TaxID=13333 RepID=W1P5F9_AMBTC|nr:hypothetical protein AMTR_s00053p00193170 [Amborella trichopoda]
MSGASYKAMTLWMKSPNSLLHPTLLLHQEARQTQNNLIIKHFKRKGFDVTSTCTEALPKSRWQDINNLHTSSLEDQKLSTSASATSAKAKPPMSFRTPRSLTAVPMPLEPFQLSPDPETSSKRETTWST